MGVGWRGLPESGPTPSPGAGGRWGVGALGAGVAVPDATRAKTDPQVALRRPRSVFWVPKEQGDCSSGAVPLSPAHTQSGKQKWRKAQRHPGLVKASVHAAYPQTFIEPLMGAKCCLGSRTLASMENS